MPQYQTPPESPHGATYTKRNAAPGDLTNINQRSFHVDRIPVIDYDGGRYAITYLSSICLPSDTKCDAYNEGVFYYHSIEPFAQELTIDGYPAKINTYEQRSAGFGYNDGPPWTFTTEETRVFYVTVKIGSTQLIFKLYSELVGLTNDDTGDLPNAVATAKWWKLDEDTELVRTFDWWIDYIRIYKFP